MSSQQSPTVTPQHLSQYSDDWPSSDSDSDYIPPPQSPSHHSSQLSEISDESITIASTSPQSQSDTYDYTDQFIEDTRTTVHQSDINHLIFCKEPDQCVLCEYYIKKYDLQ